jgi:hypothetical protein
LEEQLDRVEPKEDVMEFKASALGSLSDLVDPYGRQARLFPALITISPVALLIVAWSPALWTTLGVLVSLATSFGLMLLMSQLGRDRGKLCEGELYKSWGGKPSVALLRHRDDRIDDHTKARYRDFIRRRLPALALPSAADEHAYPDAADKAYESVTAWLLTQTRDTKRFSILFKENIAYGFRRNLRGLKPFGLAISILGALISTVMIAHKAVATGAAPAPEICVATAVVWVLAAVWMFVVTPSWVRVPADAYGAQLLAACDALDSGADKPARRPSTRAKR